MGRATMCAGVEGLSVERADSQRLGGHHGEGSHEFGAVFFGDLDDQFGATWRGHATEPQQKNAARGSSLPEHDLSKVLVSRDQKCP